jgi:hypothetical protein
MLEHAFNASIPDESMLALPDMSGLGGNMDNSFQAPTAPGAGQPSQMLFPPPHTAHEGNTQWDLISLGLEEPLPSQDVIDELYAIQMKLLWKAVLTPLPRLGMLYSSKRYIQCCLSSTVLGTMQP